MAGRERGERGERDRDRSSRTQQATIRTNEYFVPRDGIDREVITADVCRYLGNDALVRPGSYEDPKTRVRQEGYFITAYRNLTSAMIADLKQDSARWEAERKQNSSARPNGISSRDANGIVRQSNTPAVEYRSSTIHQSRQYYGPSGETPLEPQQTYGAPQGYPPAAASTSQQGVYDPGPQYPSSSYASSSAYASQPATGYAAPQSYAPQDSYYVAGANMAVDPQRSDRATQQPRTVPAGGPNVQYAHSSNPAYQQQPADPRYYTQPGPSPVSSSAQYAHQQPDAFYGRGAYNQQLFSNDVFLMSSPNENSLTI